MGLDVKVYQNIKKATSQEEYDFEAFVISKDWEWKIKNLESGQYYNGDVVDDSISYPYSAHNRFRRKLIKMVGREDLIKGDDIDWENLNKDVPFFHFIDFADNEGCLDYEVSEMIFNDFQKWEEVANEKLHQYDLSYYQAWLNVFDLARHNGVVVFS